MPRFREIQLPFPDLNKIGIIDPFGEFEWVKSDFLYLPVASRRLIVQIRLSLREHLKQILYAILYGAAFIQRLDENPVKKENYGALMKRSDSFAWIQGLSQKIARRMVKKSLDWEDIAGNALVGWLKNLSRLKEKPRHIQMTKLETTTDAIKKNVYDELRKLAAETDTVEITEDMVTTDATDVVSEPLELTEHRRTELKAALGATAFRILEAQLENPELTAKEAAALFGINEKTVDRNRKKIRELREVISGILWD